VADGPGGCGQENDHRADAVALRHVWEATKPRPLRLHRRAAGMNSGSHQRRDQRNRHGQEAPIVITPRALARMIRQIVTIVRPKSGMIKRKP
jgi:hypothetical protein